MPKKNKTDVAKLGKYEGRSQPLNIDERLVTFKRERTSSKI